MILVSFSLHNTEQPGYAEMAVVISIHFITIFGNWQMNATSSGLILLLYHCHYYHCHDTDYRTANAFPFDIGSTLGNFLRRLLGMYLLLMINSVSSQKCWYRCFLSILIFDNILLKSGIIVLHEISIWIFDDFLFILFICFRYIDYIRYFYFDIWDDIVLAYW